MRALVLGIVVVTLGGASVWAALHPSGVAPGKTDKRVERFTDTRNIPPPIDWKAAATAHREWQARVSPAEVAASWDCTVFRLVHPGMKGAHCLPEPQRDRQAALHFGPARGAAQ